MRKLRLRFKSLYTEYGCSLRTVFIVQAITILLMTIDSVLDSYSETWHRVWRNNDKIYSILRVLGNIVNWIIPMIAQLSCLIFGYIRHTKPNEENERPPYITYFDPIVEYYTRKNSQAQAQTQAELQFEDKEYYIEN